MSGRKRRLGWWVLFVAFVVVPLVEIFVIIQIGHVIGPWWTIALLVADSVLGSWLIKREGARAWRALRVALREGRMPSRELADGMLILIGGTLMLTPGFVSDVVGIWCILPFTRPAAQRLLTGFVNRRLAVPRASYDGRARQSRGASGPTPGNPWRRPEDVVRGEVVDPPR